MGSWIPISPEPLSGAPHPGLCGIWRQCCQPCLGWTGPLPTLLQLLAFSTPPRIWSHPGAICVPRASLGLGDLEGLTEVLSLGHLTTVMETEHVNPARGWCCWPVGTAGAREVGGSCGAHLYLDGP